MKKKTEKEKDENKRSKRKQKEINPINYFLKSTVPALVKNLHNQNILTVTVYKNHHFLFI